MRRQTLLASGFLLLTGCINLSPTTYHCAGNPEFAERFMVLLEQDELPGVEPGMTREQVREVYQELRQDPGGSRLTLFLQNLVLDDTEPDLLYFKAGACPVMRYRFKNNHLVAIGALRMEAGIWHYSNKDYLETRSHWIRTKNGRKGFRLDPKYDERGNLIGIDKTAEQPKQ